MSKWTAGTKAPVTAEIDSSSFVVEGALPPLNGRLVRMGPNPTGTVPADYNWFTGPGMIHALDLADGAPQRFLNRWVRTAPVASALDEADHLGHVERIDVANTSALHVAGELLAMTEGCTPYVIGSDLETLRRQDFGGKVQHFTAHPHTDPASGEVYGVGYTFDADPSCTLYRISDDGCLVDARKIELLSSRPVHDFAFTENHIVIWDLPVDNIPAQPGGGVQFNVRWNADGGARVGLLRRDDLHGQITWFELNPCWVFHPVNAYDDGQGVVVDVCQFDRIFSEDLTGPGDPYPPQLWRWELDLATERATQTLVDERIQEFARINPRHWGQPYRFGYTTELMSSNGAPSIIAHDLQTGTSETWVSEPGRSLSEAVFVPDEAERDENAGWLLAIDSTRESSDLVVLDATEVAQGPVARVRLPQRIPDGFHGDWIPSGAEA